VRLQAALLLGAATLGCSPAIPAEPGTAADLQVVGGVPGASLELGGVASTPGRAEYELSVAGQGSRAALIWMPEAPPRTLIVLLHGATQPSKGSRPAHELDPSRSLLECLAVPALGVLSPIIIAPRSPDGRWWNRSDTEYVLGLVLAARNRWPAAAAKSVILGYSNGGIGAWYFARLYPEYFAAAIPMAFNSEIIGPTKVPVYAIFGSKDELFDAALTAQALQAAVQRHEDVTLNEKYRGSHFAPCSYVPELTSAGHWLEQRVLSAASTEAVP
jgi:pimeloyl-ACP methyl ester carboxylesterase